MEERGRSRRGAGAPAPSAIPSFCVRFHQSGVQLRTANNQRSGGAASLRPPPFRPPSFREDREKGHGKVSHGQSSASSQTSPRFRTPLFPPLIFLRCEFARNENWKLRSGEGKTWIGFANEVRRTPRPSLVEGGGGKGSKGVIVNVNRSPVTQINIRVYPVDNRSAELARGWHADNYERGRKSLVAGGR